MLRHPVVLACLEVLTVGLPFCVFKALAGVLLGPWGVPLLALAACDLLLNVGNFVTLVVTGQRRVPICSLEVILRPILRRNTETHREVGAALDVALSFLIVAIVIGAGLLDRLAPLHVQAWSLAVVLNVLGAGLFQVNQAYARLRE